MNDLLSPNAYMDLLLERQREYEQEHPPVGWVRTLPTWFIRDGDEHLVDMDAIEAANTAVERRREAAHEAPPVQASVALA